MQIIKARSFHHVFHTTFAAVPIAEYQLRTKPGKGGATQERTTKTPLNQVSTGYYYYYYY